MEVVNRQTDVSMYPIFKRTFYHSGKALKHLFGSIKSLENNVVKERASFRAQIQKLRAENAALSLKVQQFTASANRKPGDGSPAFRRRNRMPSTRGSNRSRSSSTSSRNKTSSLSSGASSNLFPVSLL